MFRKIKTTMILTHLVTLEEDDYVCKVTKTIEEAKQLIEAGFEYFCNTEGPSFSESANRK